MTDDTKTHEFHLLITVSMTDEAMKALQAAADNAMDSAAEKFPSVPALNDFQRSLITRALLAETATELCGGAMAPYIAQISAGSVTQPPAGSCNAIHLQPSHTPGATYSIELHDIELGIPDPDSATAH